MRFFLYLGVFLMLSGVCGVALTLAYPPELYDADGDLIGEMPPAFALFFFLTAVGAALTALTLFVKAVVYLRRRFRPIK